MRSRLLILIAALLALSPLRSGQALAEEEGGAPSSTGKSTAAGSPSAGLSSPSTAAKSRKSKGKRPREKEIEGTEARDRFQADIVLKSKYQHNGEQLEVDPD